MLRVVQGLGGPLTAEYEVGFIGADGAETRASLTNSAGVRFEQVKPVRAFSFHKRQRHFPGLWWSSTTGRHVGYESWLERDHLMLLDFDPAVVGIASQPFWLFWDDDAGRRRSHAPDYFARLMDGRGVVVDCRPAALVKPRDVAAFEATRRACELVEWEYRRMGTPESETVLNVRWLAGYRHPRYHLPVIADALREVFADPAPLMVGAGKVGDPIAVLPVLFHLLWRRDLTCDLRVRLHGTTLVAAVVSR